MKLVKVDFKSNSLEVEPQSQSVVVKDICVNLGLTTHTQITKLKSDPTYQSTNKRWNARGLYYTTF